MDALPGLGMSLPPPALPEAPAGAAGHVAYEGRHVAQCLVKLALAFAENGFIPHLLLEQEQRADNGSTFAATVLLMHCSC